MAKETRYECEWKLTNSSSKPPSWHGGSLLLHHSDKDCWEMALCIRNDKIHTLKLQGEISKIVPGSDTQVLKFHDGSCSLKFSNKTLKNEAMSIFKEIHEFSCDQHAGLKCVNTAKGSAAANNNNPTTFTKMKNAEQNIRLPAVWDTISYSKNQPRKENKSVNNFLESSASKANKTLTAAGFYGNKSALRPFSQITNNETNSYPAKRKPGFLTLDENEPKKVKVGSEVHSVTKKQQTLDYTYTKRLTPTAAPRPGFSNLGNTCYMNAILQSLFCLVPFALDLQSVAQTKPASSSSVVSGEKQNRLCQTLARLLQLPVHSNTVAEREHLLSRVKEMVAKDAKRFRGHEQNDAHEFLSQLLDQLKGEVSGVSENQPASPDSSAAVAAVNPTIQNFESEFLQIVTCTNCKEEYRSQFIGNDIYLEVPQSCKRISIQDLIRHFFQPRIVEYKCKKCDNNEGMVNCHFIRLPRILILLLKRYQFNSSRHQKLFDNVVIPSHVTLTENCVQDAKPPSKLSSLPQLSNMSAWPKFNSTISTGWKSLEKSSSNGAAVADPFDFIPTTPKSSNDEKSSPTSSGHKSSVAKKYFNEDELMKMSDDDQLALALNLSRNVHESGGDFDNDDEVEMHLPENVVLNSRNSDPLTDPDDAWPKSLTPVKPSLPSVGPESRRVSKELFPSSGIAQDPSANFIIESDLNSLPMDDGDVSDLRLGICRSLDEPSPTSSLEKRKNNHPAETFDTSEDKENVLPSFGSIFSERKSIEDGVVPLGERQTQDQFDKDIQTAIELSLQIQGMNEEESRNQANAATIPDSDNQTVETNDDDSQWRKTAEAGELPHSYRLMSVVSHLGDSLSTGHYVTDVYDICNNQWHTCDDSSVSLTTEENMRTKRQRSGYIFFYLNKDLVNEIKNCKTASAPKPVS